MTQYFIYESSLRFSTWCHEYMDSKPRTSILNEVNVKQPLELLIPYQNTVGATIAINNSQIKWCY